MVNPTLFYKIILIFIAVNLTSCSSFRGFKPTPAPSDYWAPYSGFNEQSKSCTKSADSIDAFKLGQNLTDGQIKSSRWVLEQQCLIENGYLLRSGIQEKGSTKRYICEYREALPVCNTPFWQDFFQGKTRSERPFIDSVVNPIEKSKEREYEKKLLSK